MIETIIDCHETRVVRPLFEDIHGKVSKETHIWRRNGEYLTETHADKRKELDEKLLLGTILEGGEELLSDTDSSKLQVSLKRHRQREDRNSTNKQPRQE